MLVPAYIISLVVSLSSAGKKSVQTADTREIARSTSNDANKTRNKPLSDTRVLIARVPKRGHARPLLRVSAFF